MVGQVNRGSLFGEKIYEYTSNKNFTNFVEVGTWNGEGSTKCFMDAILQRGDNSRLYSLEANIEFYNQASHYWRSLVENQNDSSKKLVLLYGRIIEVEDLIPIEEVQQHAIYHQHPWLEWRTRNIKEYGMCENVLSELPEEIDILCLDGGQFSTRSEFATLKGRTKMVMLDDTNTFKTESIRKEIIEAPQIWTVVEDSAEQRHGYMIAIKKDFVDLLEKL